MKSKDENTTEAIRYFVAHLSGSVGRTQLAKLLYLADYEARRYLGKPITALRYRFDKHGPYDRAFPDYVDALKAVDEVREDVISRPTGGTTSIFHLVGGIDSDTLTLGEKAVLAYVLETYGRRPLYELLYEIVYETEPMRLAKKRGVSLRMSAVDDEAREDLGGVDIERLLESEQQARRGEGTSLDEFERELLGQVDGQR